jgi:hypothetical protein
MENFVKIDRLGRRVTIRAQGQWTLGQADAYFGEMAEVLHWSMQSGEPITIFADLDGLIVHPAEVARRLESAVDYMRQFPLKRYALIVPSVLMRMQCRRLLSGIDHSYFEDGIAAKRWLGWNGAERMAA